MTRTTARTAAKRHQCDCGHIITKGERYLAHVASPNHGSGILGNDGWLHFNECDECATRYGRAQLLATS